MTMIYKGIVTKQVSGRFSVKVDEQNFTIYARNLRHNGIFVGDEIQTDGKVLIKTFPRKNYLIRPTIANVDQLIIVVSEKPATDFLLIDKLIMFANNNNIDTIICINKIDLSVSLFNNIESQYKNVVKNIIKTSAINDDVQELLPLLKDKISVFAGQSAVGKSTLLNKILKSEVAHIGEMSKIERGRNTTRETELYSIDKNSFIADTPGFSCLELANFSPEEISQGYKEFYNLSSKCKYRQCDHIFVDECDCEVLQKIKQDKGLMPRYERYKDLYIETKEIWRKRYGK